MKPKSMSRKDRIALRRSIAKEMVRHVRTLLREVREGHIEWVDQIGRREMMWEGPEVLVECERAYRAVCKALGVRP